MIVQRFGMRSASKRSDSIHREQESDLDEESSRFTLLNQLLLARYERVCCHLMDRYEKVTDGGHCIL